MVKAKPTTQAALAKALGVTSPAISGWRDRFQDSAPEGNDVDQWKAFIAENGLGSAGNRLGGAREKLLEGAVERRNRLLDLQIAKEERRVVLRADVDKMLLHVGSMQKARLYAALCRELPGKCVGRTASEIAIVGRSIADELADTFAGEVKRWQTADE